MSFMRKILQQFLILYLLTLNLSAFEQNGVKSGNMKISATLSSNQDNDDYNTADFYSQIGYFYNKNIEVLIGLQLEEKQKEIYYTPSIGANYYFYNSPIITPYIGGQIFYKNTTNEYIREKKGDKFYIGTHLFISEDVAITPEYGVIYLDFNTEKGTYFNTFLTYFF